MKFPVKLDDRPCRGTDPDGERVYFDDLLFVGTKVGDPVPGDPFNAFPPFGVVVEREDGLWIVAEEEVQATAEDHKSEPAGSTTDGPASPREGSA